jgi:very-short-patch-repair endonuclease
VYDASTTVKFSTAPGRKAAASAASSACTPGVATTEGYRGALTRVCANPRHWGQEIPRSQSGRPAATCNPQTVPVRAHGCRCLAVVSNFGPKQAGGGIVSGNGEAQTAQAGSDGPNAPTSRVLSLIEFLREFDALKHPPVRDVAAYRAYRLEPDGLDGLNCVKLHTNDDDWLDVSFVERPPTPAVPEELQPWLECGDAPTSAERPGVERPENWDPASEADLWGQANAWIDEVWAPWAEEDLQAQRDKRFYRRLFEQMQELSENRESLELCWGFAVLKWSTEGHTVAHPLFVVPVDIEITASRQLKVQPTGALEIDTLCLANLNLANRSGLAARRELLEGDPFDPWDESKLRQQSREVVRMLSLNGVVKGEGTSSAGAPVIELGWVLFVRRKRPDYQGFLDKMRQAYLDGATIPIPLLSTVIDEPMKLEDRESAPGRGIGDRLLLPLPANSEQQSILELAQTHSGVVVQGPPGTGKSHTIANLISHYVAYGQRVLVVAEKEQALQVLAEKIPAEIRDLTVSVLGADAEGRKRLESSINAIQTRVSQIDPVQQDQLIARLTRDVDALDSRIAETTGALLVARRSEVERLHGSWPCGVKPGPETVARWVAEHADEFDVVPDKVGPDDRCPLTTGEVAELQRLVGEVGAQRATETAFTLPDIGKLPDSTDLAQRFEELTALRDVVQPHLSTVHDKAALSAFSAENLTKLADDLHDEAETLKGLEQPWIRAFTAAQGDELQARDWAEFLTATAADRERIFELRPRLSSHQVTVPAVSPDVVAKLSEAKQRLAAKGKLGMFASDAKQAVASCTVNGRPPATADEVELCLLQLRLQELRDQVARRWATQLAPVESPALQTERPEDEVGGFLALMSAVEDSPTRWAALGERVGNAGLVAPKTWSVGSIEQLESAARGLLPLFDAEKQTRELDTLRQYLTDGAGQQNASSTWSRLRDALASRDVQGWAKVRDQVLDLKDVAPQAARLMRLSQQLSTVAPVWTQSILADPEAAKNAEQAIEYWSWRQSQTWLESIWATGSPSKLQTELEDLAVRRRRAVSALVGARAWSRLKSSIQDPQRQALNAYKAAMKNHGKTGGKYKARWLAQIRDALNRSKDAVPVWVMPASRALTSFRPEKVPPFDVLIVDEASQLSIDAIPLLSLAKKAIIVGDDKQTSPSAVGVNQEEVHRLIDSHLREVPNAKVLFNAGDSLYDLAGQKFPTPVMLVEHFRSLPEIIAFSNRHIYNDKIEPLRDQRPSPGWVGLGAVKVSDGYRVGKDTNPNEARVVTELVEQFVADPQCNGKSIGVVSLLSTSGQAELLRGNLFDSLGPAVVSERKLRVGDAAQFQGDERDIMVISLVVGTDPGNPLASLGAMTDRSAQQRINVAASRARDQMWVVHSVDPERFAQGDLRAALIRHCRDPHSIEEILEDQLAKCDSEFEKEVLRRIVARGYARVRSQVRVGAESNQYRIDLVVDGPTSRLAVECDGEQWHGPEQWHADRARQEVLERAGWTFERIRGSAFYRDPDQALEPLWARLEALGIPTGDEWLHVAQPTIVTERVGNVAIGAVAVEDIDTGDDLDLQVGETPTEKLPDAPRTPPPATARQIVEVAAVAVTPVPAPAAPDREEEHLPLAQAQLEMPEAASATPREVTHRPAAQAPVKEVTATPRQVEPSRQSRPQGASAKPAQPRVPAPSTHRTKSDLNKALAKALRDLGKPANGDTWHRAKKLVQSGSSIEEAAAKA